MSRSMRTAGIIPLEPKNFVRGTVLIISLAAMVWISYELRFILALILLAIFIAMSIDPLIVRLMGKGLSRSQSVLLVLLVLLILICATAITIAPLVIDQTNALLDLLPTEYEAIRLRLVSSSSQPINLLASQLPAYDDLGQFLNLQPQVSKDTLNTLLIRTGDILRLMIAIIMTMMMVSFWMLEGPTLVALIRSLLPTGYQERFDDGVRFVQTSVGGFVRGQTILCLIIGLMSFVAYVLIGLPYPFILAIFAGLLEAVPIIGPTLGAIPAGLVAAGVDPGLLVGVVVATLIIQGVENGLLVPRVLGKSVGVHPVLVLLSLSAFTAFLGLSGALLAIPMASLFQNMIRRQMRMDPDDVGDSNSDDSQADLIDEVVQLQVEVEELTRRSFGTDQRPVNIGQQLAGILRDLHRLLSQHEEIGS